VEVKKLSLFPRCCLDQLANSVAKGVASDQVLENPGSVERDGWLRQCSRIPGHGRRAQCGKIWSVPYPGLAQNPIYALFRI
jgi:hypothetical protein